MSILLAIRQNSLGLAIFAVITAGAIALTQVLTKDRIAENRAEAQAKALYQIVPKSALDNDLLEDKLIIQDATSIGYDHPIEVYRARKNGQITTVIFPVVAPDGYTGNIDMIVGVNADGSMAGLRVLAHQETPGLGDRVELKKSDWVLGFANQSLDGPDDHSWAVKKDGGRFDQFTGATITPRAVVNAAKRALLLFQQHKQRLLESKPREVSDHG